MRNRRLVLLIGTICLASCWALLRLGSDSSVAHAQQSTGAIAEIQRCSMQRRAWFSSTPW